MWYLVLSRTVGEAGTSHPLYRPHADWLDQGHRSGRILFSGPTSDRSFGIYVVLASNIDEAKQYAAQDPYHQAGLREMQVLEWDVRRAFRLDRTIADVEAMARAE